MNGSITAGVGEGSSLSPFRHRYAVLIIVPASVLMAVIDGSVVNISLPTMTPGFLLLTVVKAGSLCPVTCVEPDCLRGHECGFRMEAGDHTRQR